MQVSGLEKYFWTNHGINFFFFIAVIHRFAEENRRGRPLRINCVAFWLQWIFLLLSSRGGKKHSCNKWKWVSWWVVTKNTEKLRSNKRHFGEEEIRYWFHFWQVDGKLEHVKLHTCFVCFKTYEQISKCQLFASHLLDSLDFGTNSSSMAFCPKLLYVTSPQYRNTASFSSSANCCGTDQTDLTPRSFLLVRHLT